MEMVRTAVLLPFDKQQRELLEAAGKGRCAFSYIDLEKGREERLKRLVEAEIIFGEPTLAEIWQCPRLRWLQTSFAGVDRYTMAEGFPSQKVMLTNARGCFGTVIAEYIVAVILELSRNLKQYALLQQKACFRPLGFEMLLFGKHILILGAGDIGTAAAKRLKAFGTYLTGMRRTERNYPDCFDEMITEEDLESALSKADIVVGCLPATEKTRGLLNLERLHQMKKGAFLINVGRGNLIDTKALTAVLEEGWLGGAALDVTDPEPLPEEHPLWKMEQVILTPHIAGVSFGYSKDTENRILHICCQNLERYLTRKELLNQVNFSEGYVSEL